MEFGQAEMEEWKEKILYTTVAADLSSLGSHHFVNFAVPMVK